MKSQKTFSIFLAAGLAGVALVALSNASFLASVPAELFISAAVGGAIVGLAVADYSRRLTPLKVLAPVLRPSFPKNPVHTSAYGIQRRDSVTVDCKAA